MQARSPRNSFYIANVLSLLACTPAFAQDGLDSDTSGVDIVVTARRVEERLQDVPISISVLSQDQINNRNITTAADLATYTPSLTVDNRFGPDNASFIIRGFSQIPVTSPTVGVYFADVIAPRSTASTGGGNGGGPGNLFDLQNVQVLKGPQGTLFGRNTTGGAILLVPQKPTDRLEGYVEGSIGNYDMRRVQAVLNVPLADTFKVRLGLDRQVREGYLRNKSNVGPKDFGDVNYWALRGSITADLTPDLENYMVARYSRSDTNGTKYKLLVCNRGTNPAQPRSGRAAYVAPAACDQIDRQAARGDGFYDVENNVLDPFQLLEEWQVINTTTWTASDALTIKNIASYAETREQLNVALGGERFFVSASGPAVGPVGAEFANLVITNAPNEDAFAQSTFTEELQLQGKAANGRLVWQVGGYLEISKPIGGGSDSYSSNLTLCTNAQALQCRDVVPGGSLSIVYNKQDFRNIGFYGQGSYAITDQLTMTAGLRYTIDKTTGSGQRVTVNFPTPNNPVGRCANPAIRPGLSTLRPSDCQSRTFVQKSERPTWTVDLEYKPITDAMIFAKWSRGYRQGGLNPSNIGLETWRPEKVDTYEIGAKTSFSGAVRGYFNVTAFYNDFRDQQLSAGVIGCTVQTCGYNSGLAGANLIVNAGKSRIYGLEVDSAIVPLDGLKFDVGYAFLNTKLQEFTVPALGAGSPYASFTPFTVGGPLPRSPKHRVSFTGTYTLPLGDSIGRISIGATYVYTSGQVTDASSVLSPIPGTNLVNLNLDWKSVGGAPVDLGVFVTNLTKEEDYLNTTNSWSSLGFEQVVTNQPRMFGVRLKYRFEQ